MLSDEDLTFMERIRYFWMSRAFPKPKEGTANTLAQDFYSAPTIKYLSQKSGDLPSSIDADTFSKTMIYLLAEEGESSMKIVETKLDSYSDDPETLKHLKFLLLKAGADKDIEEFEKLLKSWYEEMMERCLGWYKKRVQVILLIFGFFIASTFNLNSLYLVKVLTHDNLARDGIVKMAGDYVEVTNNINVDSLKSESYQELKKTHAALKTQSEELNGLLGLKSLPASITYEVMERDQFDTLTIRPTSYSYCSHYNCNCVIVYTQPEGWSYLNLEPYVEFTETMHDQGSVSLNTSWFYWNYSFWGYLITALAISLGAPFWFDLLNKLMLLRSSFTRKVSTGSQTNSTKSQNI